MTHAVGIDSKARFSRNNAFGLLSLLITILIAVFWQGNTPLDTDDFIYQHEPVEGAIEPFWDLQGDMITSVNQIPNALAVHRQYVNGRISNSAYIVFQLFPIWFIKYFCGLMLGLFAIMLWRWCGKGSVRNQTLAIAIPLLLWTGLQWNDQMQSSDFQFNYTLPSLMMTCCLILFDSRRERIGVWGWLLLVLFSVWHECFTIALGFFLGTQWLFDKKRRTLLAIAILIAGALFQYSAGTSVRMDKVGGFRSMEYYPWVMMISKSWVSVVALLWWLVRRRQVSQSLRRNLDCFAAGFLAAWLAALFILIYLHAPQRSHWPNDVLGILLILLIVKTYRPLKLKIWLQLSLLSLYALWGFSLIRWEIKVKEFTNMCIEDITADNIITSDRDNFLADDIPFWLMGMPSIQYGSFNYWPHTVFAYCNTQTSSWIYLVLPEQLKDSSFEAWPKMPGDNDFRRVSKEIFVRKHDGTDLTGRQYLMRYGCPGIGTTPLDIALGFAKGFDLQSAEVALFVKHQMPFEYMGDSLEVVFFQEGPRTVQGRPILGMDRISE